MYKSNKSKKNFNTSDTVCPPRYLYNIYFRAIICSILAVFWLQLIANMLISKPMRCLHNLSFHFRIILPTFVAKKNVRLRQIVKIIHEMQSTFAAKNSRGYLALAFGLQMIYLVRQEKLR